MTKRKDQQPTYTALILEVLGVMDGEPVTATQICQLEPKINRAVCNTCLRELRRYKTVDCISVDDRLHWFLTGTDERTRVYAEKSPPNGPIRARRIKPSPTPPGDVE